jgi:drug/metabolite transporter (DMT)-like permease
MNSAKTMSIALAICATFFWGANFNVGKYVVDYMPSLVAAGYRFSLASFLLIVMLLCTESLSVVKSCIKKYWIPYVGIGIAGVAGFNGLFFVGLKYSNAVNSALIMATNPLISVLLSKLFFRGKIHKTQGIGMIISLLGVIIIFANNFSGSGFVMNKGDGIIFLANICWALYGVLTSYYLYESPTMITTTMTMLCGTVVLLFSAWMTSASVSYDSIGWGVYLGIFYVAFFGTVLAYLFWNISLSKLGIQHVAVYFNLVPMFAVLIAFAFGHPISLNQIIGGALVLVGVVVARL